jgi:cell wall-associated NlpC family hydrolase
MRRRVFLAGATGAVALAWYKSRDVTTTMRNARRQAAVVATAIGYARVQTGKPYLWGGTGPAAFDCSGLVYEAYEVAGIAIARTTQEQWAMGRRVSAPEPGDLVFFPGSDGTRAAPGHVGLVTGPHQMIQAYAPGTPIGTYPFGVAGALGGTGPGTIVGYTRPWWNA